MDFQVGFIFVYCATYFFCAAFSIVLFFRINSDVARELEIHFFRTMLVALIVYCFFESLWALGNFGNMSPWNRLNIPLSIVNHIMVMGICFYWFCYVEAHLQSRLVDRVRSRLIAAIPLMVAILVTVSSPWTGWVFAGFVDGAAQRGPMYNPVLVITYGYALAATMRAIQAGRHATSPAHRNELYTMASFAIPPAIVGVVDTIIPFMPIVAPAFFFSFLFIFTMIQEGQISHDALTDLNNRRRAERYFDEVIEEASSSNPFYFFVLDGDKFKTINDTYGHSEGDRALCAIAEALRNACSDSNVFAARWGGDEFAVMGLASEVGEPQVMINRIQECLRAEHNRLALAYPLEVSIGYAQTDNPHHSKRALIEEADQMLYEQKKVRRQVAQGH